MDLIGLSRAEAYAALDDIQIALKRFEQTINAIDWPNTWPTDDDRAAIRWAFDGLTAFRSALKRSDSNKRHAGETLAGL